MATSKGDKVDAQGRLIVVGLGNPGAKYGGTRHNIGFRVVDHLAARWSVDLGRSKFKAHYGTDHGQGRQVALLKPQTYMNLSGQSVVQAMQFFNTEPGGVIVVHDDIDLAFGVLRLKRGGGAGGHNGLKSLDQLLGDKNYFRVRFGVGRPQHGSPSDHVLGRFTASEEAELYDTIQQAADATCALIEHGLREAQNKVHAANPKGSAASNA